MSAWPPMRRQTLLLFGTLASALAWMLAPPMVVPRGVRALCFSALLVRLTDRGDKAVREQTGVLRQVMAAWPLPARTLLPWARTFSLAPALLALALLFALGITQGAWDRTAGRAFLALACVASHLDPDVPLKHVIDLG
jgi:hypothetical protein